MARLQETYAKEIAPALMKKFNYKSVMQIPKLDKVVINVGCGEARDNPKIMDAILSDLAKITGQKPIVCKAKKSVASFFSVALPRVRDFRGINGNSFDGRGNYSCGVKEQLIFPEIDYDKIDAVRGMDICFVTTAKTDEEAKELLKALGAPFAN